MPDPAKSDLAALNNALAALNALQVALQILGDDLASLQRQTKDLDLHFDKGKFIGTSWKSNPGEIHPADGPDCIGIQSDCEWLPRRVEALWESHSETNKALDELPHSLTDKLDRLIRGGLWVALVRRHCVDKVLAWPGEKHHQLSRASEKVLGTVPELLKKAAKYDPIQTWNEFQELILGYKADLIAVRGEVQPKPDASVDSSPSAAPDAQKKDAGNMPDSPDVRDLCHLLSKSRDRIASGKTSAISVAREFTKEQQGNDPKAQSLMRQARRFRHLWKRADN